ncbi:type IV pilus twitching motility protein PilT [Candidatus Cloacimonadota bacterium]
MSFSFLSEMQVAVPSYQLGAERVQTINKIISINEDWKFEAYKNIIKLLKYMREVDASDIDLGGPGCNDFVWFRIYGVKEPATNFPQFSNDETTAMLLSILTEAQKITLLKQKNVDFSLSIELEEGEELSRFRGDIYFECNELVANFRRINEQLFNIRELGYPDTIIKRLNLKFEKSGLYLITGITGSGKSCTLDSIVDMNNHTNKGHIVIIGNPIEYLHKSLKCIIRHREIGHDVLSFNEGTYQALRQDPDIIVVGEMRDSKTIVTVLEVTDSGHKVFTTLHTSTAVESIHRIIAEFPPNEQERVRMRLADTLKVIISQKLVPSKDGKLIMCKEILSVDASVQAAIRNKNINEIYQMINEGKRSGMITMEQDLYQMFRNGKITQEVAMNYANNKKRMEHLIAYAT